MNKFRGGASLKKIILYIVVMQSKGDLISGRYLEWSRFNGLRKCEYGFVEPI